MPPEPIPAHIPAAKPNPPPPAAARAANDAHNPPPPAADSLSRADRNLAARARAASTKSAYAVEWEKWTRFAAWQGIPALPALPDDAARFITALRQWGPDFIRALPLLESALGADALADLAESRDALPDEDDFAASVRFAAAFADALAELPECDRRGKNKVGDPGRGMRLFRNPGRPASPTALRKALAAINRVHADAGLAEPCGRKSPAALRAGAANRDERAGANARTDSGIVAPWTESKGQAAALTATSGNLGMAAKAARAQGGLKGKRDKAIILVGHAAACRVSELTAANVRDFRPDTRTLVFPRRKNDQGGDRQQVARLSAAAANALCEYLAARQDSADEGSPEPDAANFWNHRPTAPLFASVVRGKKGDAQDGGRRMTRHSFAQMIAEYTAGKTPHGLRVGFAVDAALAGCDVAAIAEHGGWSDLRQAGHYAKEGIAAGNEAAQAIDKLTQEI